jgi:hypothetical protein
MAIDPSKLREVAAKLVEELEKNYGEDAELDEVMIIAAVTHDGEESSARRSTVHVHMSSDPLSYKGLGLLQHAQQLVSKSYWD